MQRWIKKAISRRSGPRLLKAFYRMQKNMSVKKNDIDKIMSTVFKRNQKKWNLKDAAKGKYVQDMSLRWRCMCACFAKAVRTKPMPSWAAEILNGSEKSGAEEADDKSNDEEDDEAGKSGAEAAED